jgi:PAT family beta-lactamase induction signal transducer AmpG
MPGSSHSGVQVGDAAAGGAGIGSPGSPHIGRPGWRIYAHPRMAVLAGLGVASGLPLMLTGRTMRLWAARQGLDLKTVGLFSLVTLPYSFKFLWAPLADRYTPPLLGPLGRRRAWLLAMQLLLVAAIAAMAILGPRQAGAPLRLFALAAAAVALLSASQDISADAYRTDILEPAEWSAGAAVFTGAYRLAMLASGAGVICLVDRPFNLSWRGAYLFMAGLMGLASITTLRAPRPESDLRPPGTLTEAVVQPARAFLRRFGRSAPAVLLFVLLFKLPDYMSAAVCEKMLADLGFSNREIGLLSFVVGVAVTIPGALAGGWVLAKLRLVPALLVFALAHSLSNLGYLALVHAGHSLGAAAAAVAGESFGMGLAAAGLMAFLMSLCDKKYSATQFALLSGLMALGSALAGVAGGALAQILGYPRFFLVCILSGLPGVALLAFLPAAPVTAAAPGASPAPPPAPKSARN